MIDAIPAGAILRTLERECRMLEDDLAHQRSLPHRDVDSILSFRLFIESVISGRPAARVSSVPLAHLVFYQRTLGRLMEAGELAAEAKEQFDDFFSSPSLSAPQGQSLILKV